MGTWGAIVGWVREWTNQPRSSLPPDSACFEFDHVTRSGVESASDWLERASVSAPAEAADRLAVFLTTYRRAPALDDLLAALRPALAEANLTHRCRIFVLEDHSGPEFREAYDRLRFDLDEVFRERLVWMRARRHLGKPKFWAIYQLAFLLAQRSGAPHHLFLQDDLEFDPSFLSRALDLQEARSKSGAHPHVLNLLSAEDDEPDGRWIDFERKPHPQLPVRETAWFDLNGFLINHAALQTLRYRVVPIDPSRWRRDPNCSSGVGRQFTRRLRRRGTVDQCFPPLVFHGSQESQMNEAARAARALDNRSLRSHQSRASG